MCVLGARPRRGGGGVHARCAARGRPLCLRARRLRRARAAEPEELDGRRALRQRGSAGGRRALPRGLPSDGRGPRAAGGERELGEN